MFPYVLKRIQLSIAASSNGLVKSAAAAFQTIGTLLTAQKTQVAGIRQNSEIKNLFIVLSGGTHLGRSDSILLQPTEVEKTVTDAITNKTLTFTDKSYSGKLSEALKTLNASGLLGTIGFFLNITRAAYDTLNLEYSKRNGKLTTSQIISLVARYLSIYGGLGNFKLFLQTLNPPCRKGLISAVGALHLDKVSPKIWGSTGTFSSKIADSVELKALDEAATKIAENFSELPFAQESDFINTYFKSEVSTAVKSVPVAGTEKIVESAVNQIAQEVELATASAITRAEASIAVRAFGSSIIIVGVAVDVLFLAAAIVTLADAAAPTAQQIIDVSTSTLSLSGSVVGVGIAFGYLESAAFPPLAITLVIGSLIAGIASAVISLVSSNEKAEETRKAIADDFKGFEAANYLNNWGDAIQFLSVYYDNTRDLGGNKNKITRWSPPDVAIFEDEAPAWSAFIQAKGTTIERFKVAATKLKNAKAHF